MKRVVSHEVDYCDFCQEHEVSYAKCLGCQKAVCYECRKARVTEFHHAVHFIGSEDGLYCSECVARLTGTGEPLFEAYRSIEQLRAEAKAFYENIEARSKVAEAKLKELRNQRGLR